MAKINITDENNELGFGEEFYVEFEVDVDYTISSYNAGSVCDPQEGSSFDIEGYDFNMKLIPMDAGDKPPVSWDYNQLDEEKKREINDWISKKLSSDWVNDKLMDHALSVTGEYPEPEECD